MSKIKCPFCNGELVGTIGHPICRNQDCVMCDDPMPQDLLEELIRTRKALDVAKGTFNWIDETYRTGQETEAEIWGKVQLAEQEITALEQKDK